VTTGSARALLQRFGTFMDAFSACFSRAPQRAAASQYLEGLFTDSERKSMQAMHGRLSDPVSYEALQHFITDSPWEAGRVWTPLRAAVPVRAGIVALDDTGFPKQGRHSVGVQRQYCGALGKIGNCQVAVSSALLAAGGPWPLTFEPYLPQSWMADPDRRRAAGIPDRLVFRETWRIALAQIRTVLQAGFHLDGITVDADYGSNHAFRAALERLGLRYGVAIRGDLVMAPHRRRHSRLGRVQIVGSQPTSSAAQLQQELPHCSRWSVSHTGVCDRKHARTHGRSERDRRNDEPRMGSGFTEKPNNLEERPETDHRGHSQPGAPPNAPRQREEPDRNERGQDCPF
jgi:SRSO17 transposase